MSLSENGRRPRGEIARVVFDGYRSNVSREELRVGHGLTIRQINPAIHHLVRYGYISPEEREQFKRWREEQRIRRDLSTFKKVAYRLNDSEKQEGVLRVCAPFFLRRFFTDEIVEITGLDKKKIVNSRVAAKGLGLEKTTVEMRGAIQRRGHPSGGVRKYSPSERNALSFAKALLEAGLIPVPEDPDPKASLNAWNKLHELFRMPDSPPLPEDNADKLRLEIYCIVIEKLLRGHTTDIVLYAEIGKSIDEEWFSNSLGVEQKFIVDVLSSEWARRPAEKTNVNQKAWREPFLGGKDENARAEMRARQRPRKPWLVEDRKLRESRVLTYGLDDRGSGPRR